MSTWRVNEEPPADYLNLLYDQDQSDVEDLEDEVLDDEVFDDKGEADNMEPEGDAPEYEGAGSWSPEAPPYSPLTSPERRERWPQMNEQAPRPAVSRDRSRSPINAPSSSEVIPAPIDVVVQIYDENGVLLDNQDDGTFLTADTHRLYVYPEESERNEGRERRTSERRGGRRGGRRCVRGVRGQNARGREYPNRGRRGGNQWEVGHPLNEIWTSDADVPPELVSLAMDVMRRRQIGMPDAARAVNERRENGSESENDDEFYDASDEVDGLPLHFEWSPMESFQGQEEVFTQEQTGAVHVVNSAYEAFRSFWDDDVIGLIVTETNRYATNIASVTFQNEWVPTNAHEILCIFAFWMMLGIVKMPTITSCFSVDPLLKTEVFRRIFTRRRYEMLSRALHFVDSVPALKNANPSNTGVTANSDPLFRLRPIITHLNSAFQSNYVLNKDICIDESLTLWKGRLSFKQYIQNKASKFGIKTFELCESVTGYLWSFIVYSGKYSETDLEQSPGVLKSTAVVKKLIGPLLNKGYRLFMDNWYNSPLLARFLKLNGTDCVGTLRSSCRDVPILISKAPLKRGQLVARHSGDVAVLSWLDKKRINMISTCHGSSCALPTVSSRPTVRPVPFKPQMVLDYNKFMGGVDLKDQMLEPYLLERKRCTKWYMKLFKRLLNVSIHNSRILLQSSTQTHKDHLVFRLQLVDSILTNHLVHCPKSRKNTISSSRSMHDQPDRYVLSTHWPVLLEPTESTSARHRKFFKRCVVCLREGRKNQKTPYYCESCHVPLCAENCFKSYHTI